MSSRHDDGENDAASVNRPRRGWLQRRGRLAAVQWGLLLACFVLWYLFTKPGLLPPLYFDDDYKAAFFFGEPLVMLERLQEWFIGDEKIGRAHV